jgi:site-specific recombinase XerD
MTTKALPDEVQPRAASRYRRLPVLGPILDNWLAWLRQHGYSEFSIRNLLVRAARLCRWLQQRRGPALRGLGARDLRAAYEHFRGQRIEVAVAARVLGRFLGEQQLLRAEPRKPLSPTERTLQSFSTYLRTLRGLTPSTVRGHCGRVQAFLQFLKLDERPAALRGVSLEQIDAFLCQAAQTNNRFSLQQIVGSLRTFLRQLYARGLLRAPLHQQIDTPRTYRLEQLPRAWPWEQVLALLRSIDCSTPGGLRDFTLLYLAARYGLRSGELVRLTLDDIDWRASTLKVRQTKTKQTLLLPLSEEGQAVLARYLSAGRPASRYRELFLRRKAPAGPLAPTAVHDALERRIALSGLQLPPLGSHALRHSLAAHLLRQGVGLPAIGAALGHRTCESTGIYLRLAIDDLREVGLPVPQGGHATVPQRRRWKRRLVPARKEPPGRPARAGFRSGLADSLRRYLRRRRALGRDYRAEEATLRRWDAFLVRRYGKASQVRQPMFQLWAQSMTSLTATTRRQRMRVVRNFLLFHARRDPSTFIPDLKTFPRPEPPRPPRLVSTTEMAHLLATASVLPPSHRNPLRAPTIRLALVLLFCCGLRRGELFRLRVRHFDPQEKVLRIEATKFHKSRLVPLPDSVSHEVQRYLALRGDPLRPEAPLLCSNPRLGHETTYSAHALSENWQLLCLTTGVVDERGRPPRLHDLRHSCAVAALERWYQHGVAVQSKLPHLATYLGHVSVVSTHYYLRLSSELGQSASQRFHQYARTLFTPGDLP